MWNAVVQCLGRRACELHDGGVNSPSCLHRTQLNIHLRMFRFPHKKSQLGQANNILKVAASLVKVGGLLPRAPADFRH